MSDAQDFSRRPARRLLSLIERGNFDFGDVAEGCEMGASRGVAASNLRQYARGDKCPSTKMVARWAAYFSVDPGTFYDVRWMGGS